MNNIGDIAKLRTSVERLLYSKKTFKEIQALKVEEKDPLVRLSDDVQWLAGFVQGSILTCLVVVFIVLLTVILVFAIDSFL